MKKRIIAICLIVIILLVGGAAVGLKLYSMYGNVWDRLHELSASMDRINTSVDALSKQAELLTDLSAKVEHLHRDAYYSGETAVGNFEYDWVEEVPPYIAHACGGIDEKTYTNSREAFLLNYEKGMRVFEIDFNLSEDGQLIASHDENWWHKLTSLDLPYTSENFNQTPLYGKYESLNCEEVVDLMAEYPDMYLVTDTKDWKQERVMLGFAQLVNYAKQRDPEILDRIVPQVYSEEMLSWIMRIYPFKSAIYTLYKLKWTEDTPESVLSFCMNSGIRFVTISHGRVTEDFIRLMDTMGIKVAVHTVNDEARIQEFFDMGADMIYTDFADPK